MPNDIEHDSVQIEILLEEMLGHAKEKFKSSVLQDLAASLGEDMDQTRVKFVEGPPTYMLLSLDTALCGCGNISQDLVDMLRDRSAILHTTLSNGSCKGITCEVNVSIVKATLTKSKIVRQGMLRVQKEPDGKFSERFFILQNDAWKFYKPGSMVLLDRCYDLMSSIPDGSIELEGTLVFATLSAYFALDDRP